MPQRDTADLISRLFSFTPRERRKPVEDYCTEALAWCLEHSPEFREDFLRFLELPQIQFHAVPVTISTQHTFKSAQANGTAADELKPLKGRLDLLIEADTPDLEFLIMVESKFNSELGGVQWEKYCRWRDSRRKDGYQQCFLVTLSKWAISPSIKADSRKRWADLQPILSRGCPNPEVSMVMKSLARFLEQEGIAPMNVQKVSPELVCAIQRYFELEQQINTVLNRFRERDGAAYLPKLSRIKEHHDQAHWKGVFSDSESYYAGFGISLVSNAPIAFLWVEFSIKGHYENLASRFSPRVTKLHSNARCFLKQARKVQSLPEEPPTFEDGRTYFPLLEDLHAELNGRPELMIEWFNSVSQEMLTLLGKQFKP